MPAGNKEKYNYISGGGKTTTVIRKGSKADSVYQSKLRDQESLDSRIQSKRSPSDKIAPQLRRKISKGAAATATAKFLEPKKVK